MAVLERAIEVATCDGCGTERPILAEGEYPDGYYGKVNEVAGNSGSDDADWYACRAAHIKAAVLTAVRRAWGHEGE